MFHPFSFICWSFVWMTTTVAPIADQQSARTTKARGDEAMMCLTMFNLRCLLFHFDQHEVNKNDMKSV